MLKRFLALFAALILMALPPLAHGEADVSLAAAADQPEAESGEAEAPAAPPSARDELIDRVIEEGKAVFDQAKGKMQVVKKNIYVCKNFTVQIFKRASGDFCMAEYPDATLFVPDNLEAKYCKPYYYGFYWQDVPPEKGNPFYVAAQFKYDKSLSKAENLEKAKEFMTQVKRGDYFQMSADYYWGVGAHSAVMISDYDPETRTVYWMDSNMVRETRIVNGQKVNYAKVQFNEEKDIDWWADAFCHKNRGATLYRLRDDIIKK